MKNSMHRYLFPTGIAAGITLAILTIASHMLLEYNIKDRETDAAVINMAGRQRMYSQRAALLFHTMIDITDEAERERYRVDLLETADLMERTHNAIVNGDKAMGIRLPVSDLLRPYYFEPPVALDLKVRRYIYRVREIAKDPYMTFDKDNAGLLFEISEASTVLLTALDQVAMAHQKENEQGIRAHKDLNDLLMYISLAILALMAIVIFMPMARRIKREAALIEKTNAQLEDVNASLEERVKDRTQEVTRYNEELKREIEERVRVEADLRNIETGLRRSEAGLAEAQRIAHVGSWNWDITNNHLIWSEETFRIFGVTPREFNSTFENFIELVHPSDRAGVEDAVDAALNDGLTFSIMHRLLLPNDEIRYVHERAEVTYENDIPVRMFGTIQDITEQKKAEEELKLFKLLIDRSSDSVFVINAHTAEFIDMNASACVNLGYSREELLSLRVMHIAPVIPDSGAWKAHVDNIKKTGSLIMEGEHMRKDGTIYPVEVSIKMVEEGERSYLVAVARDLTERKKAEEDLRLFKNLINQSNDAVFITDPESCVFMDVNERACESLGYKREELLEKSMLDIEESLTDVDTCKFHIDEVKRRGSIIIEGVNIRKDGTTFPVEASVKYVEESEKSYIVAVVRDLTERKDMESELRTRILQQRVVSGLGQMALSGRDLDVLFDEAVKRIALTLEVDLSEILELQPSGSELLLRAGVGWREETIGSGTVGAGLRSQAGYTILSNDPVIVEDLRAERRFTCETLLDDYGVVSGMSIVISGHDGPYGVMGVHTKIKKIFTHNDISFFQSVSNVLATAIERKRAEEKEAELYSMSIIDELTGLYNRRGFHILAGQQLKVAERAKKRLVIFFGDLDGLKTINDTLGHDEGDRALKETAEVLKKVFRQADIIARLGGDEFAAITTETPAYGSVEILDRLNDVIMEHNDIDGRAYELSISTGTTHYDPTLYDANTEASVTIEGLLKIADGIMYERKKEKKEGSP